MWRFVQIHTQLEELRKKYRDNTQLSQQYVERFMEDALNDKVPGVNKEQVQQIRNRTRKN